MANDEPATDQAVAAWIQLQLRRHDPFIEVAEASDQHRAAHSCDAYPSNEAPLLGAAAASTGAKRILEIGGALGYSALWLAHGASPDGVVETIEADSSHVDLLEDNVRKFGYDKQIIVHQGMDSEVLPALSGPYDLVFYDAYIPGPELIEHCERLLRPGGLLIASNIFLGRYMPDNPDLARGAAFRERLLSSKDWLVSFANLKVFAVRR